MGIVVKRLVAAVAGAVLVWGASACSSLGEGALKPLDQLENLGAGTKADYQSRMDQAPEGDKEKILSEANQVNAVVGVPLVSVGGSVNGAKFQLKADKTVEVDQNLAPLMSNATNWRVGDRSIDLCTDASCEYYSSWTVTPKTGGSGGGSGALSGYTLALLIENEAEAANVNVTREFALGK